ncbi:hypothetical protein KVR01_002328 [Diaporthe batatas]|uniref:uncharacterized protein n=1 Tax=Diaporthe batatas TaxID=748121 RepID=UPI001D0450D6|nr:uncharacterized protein KVR01_002328 [Diaporthe batatas]KAG8166639.1 hypothetical protein KVR01_002328 [Diaporthe batatas]
MTASCLPCRSHFTRIWVVIEAAECTARNGNTASQPGKAGMQPWRSGEKAGVDMIGARVTGAASPSFVVQIPCTG